MTKVYGIYGYTTVEINLPVGKAVLPLTFERGCLDRKNFRPATFITNKQYIQDMIENSPMFGSTIKLVKTYGEGLVQQTTPASKPASTSKTTGEKTTSAAPKGGAKGKADKPAEGDKTKEYPDVTTKEQLIEVVKSLGAKADVLVDDAKLKNFISKKSLVFPNFSFE